EQFDERRAHRDLVVPRSLDIADDGEDLGAAVVGLADREILLAAVVDDPRHRGEGLGVVDRRRLAVETVAGRERRLEAWLALLAFERFQQAGLLAADVGTEAVEGVQLELEAAAQDVVAEVPRVARLVQRLLEALVDLEDLAVDVVVADGRAHRVGGDRHAFDQDVRVVGEDVAILAGAGLAFVGIAHQVLLHRQGTRHEAPLQAGWEAGTTAATQPRSLDLGHHLLGRHGGSAVLAEDLLQRAVAAARFVIIEPPVAAIEAGKNLRVDVAAVEAGLLSAGLELRQIGQHHGGLAFSVATSSSSRASLM